MKLKKACSSFFSNSYFERRGTYMAQNGWTGEASLSGSRITGNTDTISRVGVVYTIK